MHLAQALAPRHERKLGTLEMVAADFTDLAP